MVMHLRARVLLPPQLPGPGEGGIGFGGPSESVKSDAFVVPDICIVGVKPDSLVERLDSLIIPIVGTEGIAFVVPC